MLELLTQASPLFTAARAKFIPKSTILCTKELIAGMKAIFAGHGVIGQNSDKVSLLCIWVVYVYLPYRLTRKPCQANIGLVRYTYVLIHLL